MAPSQRCPLWFPLLLESATLYFGKWPSWDWPLRFWLTLVANTPAMSALAGLFARFYLVARGAARNEIMQLEILYAFQRLHFGHFPQRNMVIYLPRFCKGLIAEFWRRAAIGADAFVPLAHTATCGLRKHDDLELCLAVLVPEPQHATLNRLRRRKTAPLAFAAHLREV